MALRNESQPFPDQKKRYNSLNERFSILSLGLKTIQRGNHFYPSAMTITENSNKKNVHRSDAPLFMTSDPGKAAAGRKLMFSLPCVCLNVSLCVCEQDHAKTTSQIRMKLGEGV